MFELTNLRVTNCRGGHWQLESLHVNVWQGGDVECRTSQAALTAALHHWHQPSEQEFNSKPLVCPSALILCPQFPQRVSARLSCCFGAGHRSLVLTPRGIKQQESLVLPLVSHSLCSYKLLSSALSVRWWLSPRCCSPWRCRCKTSAQHEALCPPSGGNIPPEAPCTAEKTFPRDTCEQSRALPIPVFSSKHFQPATRT